MLCCDRADRTIECSTLRKTNETQKQRHQRAVEEHARKTSALERVETQLRSDIRKLQETVSRQCNELEDSRQLTGRQAEQILELDSKQEAFTVGSFEFYDFPYFF